MFRRSLAVVVLALVTSMAANAWIWPLHHKKKNNNPLANLNSQQPDKVLFDRGEDALGHSKYDVARLTFQTLINTYPDSEYVARAKLGIGDAWYKEGGTPRLRRQKSNTKTSSPSSPTCRRLLKRSCAWPTSITGKWRSRTEITPTPSAPKRNTARSSSSFQIANWFRKPSSTCARCRRSWRKCC